MCHVVGRAAPVIECPQGHHAGAPGDAADANAVVAPRRHGACNVSAVKAAIARVGAVTWVLGVGVDTVAIGCGVAHEVVACHQLARQIGVIGQDAGINDRDDDARIANGHIPGCGKTNQRVVPLQIVGAVVRLQRGVQTVIGFDVAHVRLSAQLLYADERLPALAAGAVLEVVFATRSRAQPLSFRLAGQNFEQTRAAGAASTFLHSHLVGQIGVKEARREDLAFREFHDDFAGYQLGIRARCAVECRAANRQDIVGCTEKRRHIHQVSAVFRRCNRFDFAGLYREVDHFSRLVVEIQVRIRVFKVRYQQGHRLGRQ